MPIKMQVKQSYNGKAAGAERLSVWKNEIVTVIEEEYVTYSRAHALSLNCHCFVIVLLVTLARTKHLKLVYFLKIV